MSSVCAETLSTSPARARPAGSGLADYVALTKPRLNALVVATSAAGYFLGGRGSPDPASMVGSMLGTALVAGGAAALNQVYERDSDALMSRTRRRPVPDGRVSPAAATAFAIALASVGLFLLISRANVAAAALAFVTLVVYVSVYTPLKRRTSLATAVGAIPGALPPLIGWTAAGGGVLSGGLALVAIVFFWQLPHFIAIAWLHRDEYREAGFRMLPAIEPDGCRTGRHAVLHAAALLPVSIVPAIAGVSGLVYASMAGALGVGFLWLAVRFAIHRSDAAARWLFLASLTYLPLLWIAMIADRL